MASPTLAELNSSQQRGSLGQSPSSLVLSDPRHMHFSTVADSIGHSHPKMVFSEREPGFEDLSSSFKSIYKSLFGSFRGSSSADYLNPSLSPPVSEIDGTAVTALADSSPSAASFDGKQYDPKFTSLMDSLRDIAESNTWNRLSPSKIETLKSSFQEGGHEKLGMDADSFAELSQSFNQFLSHLNEQGLPPPPPSVSHPGEFVMPNHQLPLQRVLLPPPPPYQKPTPMTSSHVHQSHLPNPSSLTPVVSSRGPIDPPYSSYLTPPFQNPAPTLSTASRVQSEQQILFQSVATDLLDDEDDFDWSKLM